MTDWGSNDIRILRRGWRFARWILLVMVFGCIAIVIYAYPHDHQATMDQAAAAQISAKRLTMTDVDGDTIPQQPDPNGVNDSIAGIDANQNGIRDDVELAIFAKYPVSSSTSTSIRAAELQYAMDLQTDLTEVIGQTSWAAAAIQESRGFGCIYEVSNGDYSQPQQEVSDLVLNTESRKQRYSDIDQYGTAYKLSSDPDCDVIRN